jgi:hypothetical protein
MKFLPWLYADKNGKNCKIKGLRVFCFFNDKADQIEMLNNWIKELTDARDKIAETYKPPKASDIIKQIARQQPEEVQKATRSVYMAINAEKRRAGTLMADQIEKHLRQYKVLSLREAMTLYKCHSLPNIIVALRREKGMNIVNRMQQNGLFKERVYIYQENK